MIIQEKKKRVRIWMQCSPIHEKIKTNTSIKPSSGTNINLPSSKLTVLLLTIKNHFVDVKTPYILLKGKKAQKPVIFYLVFSTVCTVNISLPLKLRGKFCEEGIMLNTVKLLWCNIKKQCTRQTVSESTIQRELNNLVSVIYPSY